jgi:hypothetical protein
VEIEASVMLTIYALQGLTRIGQIDAFDTFELNERDGRVGGAVLEGTLPNPQMEALLEATDPGLEVQVAGGRHRTAYIPLDTLDTDETRSGTSALFAGPDAMGILANWLQFIRPAEQFPENWATEAVTRTELPTIALTAPIAANLAQSALVADRAQSWVVAHGVPQIGPTPISWVQEMESVLDAVTKLLGRLPDYHLTYDLVTTADVVDYAPEVGSPRRLIEFRAATRRIARDVVSLEAGTADRIKVHRRVPAVTHIYGRYSEGSERHWRTAALAPAGRWAGRRVERIRDLGQETGLTVIDEVLAGLLAQAAQAAETLEVTPAIGPPPSLGPDFRLGDLVRAVARGVTADMTVAGITVKQNARDGFSQTLELGAAPPDGLSSLLGSLDELARRLATAERR